MGSSRLTKTIEKLRTLRHSVHLPAVRIGLVAMALAAVAAFSIHQVVPKTTLAIGQTGQVDIQTPLHADGGKIVDARGKEVVLTGVNWFGLETGSFAPHGLWARNWSQMLDQMAGQGFNTLRLPYSNELFDPASKPNGIDYKLNPDLVGLTGPQILDKIVNGATSRGMMVMLDRHRPTSQAQSPLWYTDKVSEDRWIKDWVIAGQALPQATRWSSALTCTTSRTRNATWGDGNQATDWRAAAERAGNAVLGANPNWLVFVEGVESFQGKGYWWGGNLEGAKNNPVRLTDQSKLVYSAHDYSPKVWSQSWFTDPTFPANLPALWNAQWGYLAKSGTAPVVLGEFGGRSVGSDQEGVWQRKLVDYLKQNKISYTYWSWNPNSGDTGGVLADDWTTVNKDKMALLKSYQAPMAPKPSASNPA